MKDAQSIHERVHWRKTWTDKYDASELRTAWEIICRKAPSQIQEPRLKGKMRLGDSDGLILEVMENTCLNWGHAKSMIREWCILNDVASFRYLGSG